MLKHAPDNMDNMARVQLIFRLGHMTVVVSSVKQPLRFSFHYDLYLYIICQYMPKQTVFSELYSPYYTCPSYFTNGFPRSGDTRANWKAFGGSRAINNRFPGPTFSDSLFSINAILGLRKYIQVKTTCQAGAQKYNVGLLLQYLYFLQWSFWSFQSDDILGLC